MGEIVVLLPFVLLAASFVVVPFLGWGMADPRAQWDQVRSWRRSGDRDADPLPERVATRHRTVNGGALLLWLALLVWLFRTVG